MAAPTFNGTVSSTTYASRTNTTITVPASVVNGEKLLMAFFLLRDPIPTITAPSGWTLVTTSGANPITVVDGASNDAVFYLYERTASSEPADYTFTHVAASTQGFMWRSSASTVDVASARGDSSAANTTRTADSITTTGADRLLYYVGFDWANNATGETPPTGFTEILDNTLVYLAHANQASAGASGSKTNTCNSSSGNNPRGAFLVALYTAGGAYSIAANGGTYSLSGTAVTTKLGRKVAADGGTYSLSGSAVTLRRNLPLVASGGTYSITGATASLLHAWKVAANGGTYTLTGSAASLLKGAKVAADGGTYSLSGSAASLLHGWKVAANGGTYALSGSDVTLTKASAGAYTITADGGTYSLSGAAVSLLHAWKVVASGGTYALTGTAATLRLGKAVQANGGTYALSGSAVTLLQTRKVAANGGTYALSGSDVTLVKAQIGYTLAADAGTYELGGTPVSLTHHRISSGFTAYGHPSQKLTPTQLKKKVKKAVKEAVFEDGILTIQGVLDAVLPTLPASTVSKSRTQDIIRSVARALLPIAKQIDDDEDESDVELLLLVA